MNSKEFKALFNRVAEAYGFKACFGGWYKESKECIVVLDLQKSGYGNYYELNIKTYIQGVFGNHYEISKDLVKKDMGDIFTRQPTEYNDILDLDSPLGSEFRQQKLEGLFVNFIVPETNSTLTRAGIIEQASKGAFLLPAIKKELGI
ncbi:MAG TPA: DUF4304 domain-containing protein [Rhabdochlamydiaceae bacterium]|nr:DUF4304 domain-containing protein [Rhabdochlamydiaceae bacterium]